MKNKNKIILDLCGGTGSWSKPYKDAGYDVRVITLPDFNILNTYPFNGMVTGSLEEDSALGSLHFSGENEIMNIKIKDIYGILAAPPCTVFSRAAWKIPKDKKDFAGGMEIVKACLNIIYAVQENGVPLKFWALENPVGFLYNFLGRPAFYFQGWQMGETGTARTKRTAIWGYFNSPAKTVARRPKDLPPTRTSHKDWYSPKAPEWLKDKKLTRADIRAITPAGFANAFFKANK